MLLHHRDSQVCLWPEIWRKDREMGFGHTRNIGTSGPKNLQGRPLYGPILVKTETFRELWAPLVHTSFGENSYGPIIGPYLFLGNLVWTNGPESCLKFPPTLALVHGWLFPNLEKWPENAFLATFPAIRPYLGYFFPPLPGKAKPIVWLFFAYPFFSKSLHI